MPVGEHEQIDKKWLSAEIKGRGGGKTEESVSNRQERKGGWCCI